MTATISHCLALAHTLIRNIWWLKQCILLRAYFLLNNHVLVLLCIRELLSFARGEVANDGSA